MDDDPPLAPDARSGASLARRARPLPTLDARVLRAFLVDGRLVSIPAQAKKRLVVLRRYLVEAGFMRREASVYELPSREAWPVP